MKRSLVFALLVCVSISIWAVPIGKQRARQIALQFANSRGIQLKGEPRKAPSLSSSEEQAPLYIFNMQQGFVIVAGDDQAEEVLGYTEKGSYDEDAMPENFRLWLQQTADEISYVSLRLSRKAYSTMSVANHAAIEPLIKTQWNQGYGREVDDVYNALCPQVNGKYTYAGCVPTAGAQIMYYYQWPKAATKSVAAYKWGEQTLEELSPIVFNWAQMKPSYNSDDSGTESARAVAQLMRYCGQAAQVQYGLGGSSASVSTLCEGMSKFFDYDPNLWKCVYRSDYSINEWDEVIYQEIKDHRPIIMSGSNLSSGHAFICDGYDGNGLYHFNWGWGGHYDGYFKLHATNPYGANNTDNCGYIFNIYAHIGIQPNTGLPPQTDGDDNDSWEEPQEDPNDEWTEEEIEGIVAKAFGKSLEGTTLTLNIGNDNDAAYGFGYGIAELNADGSLTILDNRYEGLQSSELQKGWSYTLSFDLSKYNLSEGEHTLVPVSIRAGETEWKRARPASMYFIVNANNGAFSVTAHPVVNLSISEVECITNRMPNSYQALSFLVKNTGDHFDGTIYLTYGKNGELNKGYGTSLKIMSGNTLRRDIGFRIPEEGTYDIWLSTDYNADNIVAQTTIEIINGLKVKEFNCISSMQPYSQQKMFVQVENQGGNYDGGLYLFISKTEVKGDYAKYSKLKILSGNTKERILTFKPEEPGTYHFWLTTDYKGENVIAETDVVISQQLEATTFNVTTFKLAKSVQQVVATVNNHSGEHTEPLYLFVSPTTRPTDGSMSCAGTAIPANGSEDITFYFMSGEAGLYHIFVASDPEGKNILGTTDITIIAPPTTPATLERVDAVIPTAGSSTLMIEVKNTGNVTFYDTIYGWLYVKTGNDYEYVERLEAPSVIIEPGQTVELPIELPGLTVGKQYRIYLNYKPLYQGSSSKDLGSYIDFTYGSSPSAIQTVETDTRESQPYFSISGQRLNGKPATQGVYLKSKRVILSK